MLRSKNINLFLMDGDATGRILKLNGIVLVINNKF